MEPVRELEEALRRMRFAVEPGRFALVGFREPPAAADLAVLSGDLPSQAIREGGETTLFVPEAELPAVRKRHPGAQEQGGFAWIRFECPMGWELVGFLALVTGRLAAAGVPLGAVCAFHRDHLFVAERHLGRAREVLRDLFPEAPPAPAAEALR